jgi:integrase
VRSRRRHRTRAKVDHSSIFRTASFIGFPKDSVQRPSGSHPVPIPPRLLAHLRRWTAKGVSQEHFVEWNGRPVQSVKAAFKTAVRLAKLKGKISPHTLRRTAATWLMQAGVDKWEAAGFLGISIQMLDRVCGHHRPDPLRSAARAIGYRPRQSLPNNIIASSSPGATRHPATP